MHLRFLRRRLAVQPKRKVLKGRRDLTDLVDQQNLQDPINERIELAAQLGLSLLLGFAQRSLVVPDLLAHSFTHLGGQNASPEFAQAFLVELSERLSNTDYTVKSTPFGYFCEWQLDVHGESLAKVYKQV